MTSTGKGGAREGAGRKSNAEKYARQIGDFTEQCADHHDEAFQRLAELIQGSTRLEVRRARAGTVTRKDVARDDEGTPLADKNGKLTVIEIPIFPDLPDDEMVVVEEKMITNPPDLRAIEYLVDRFAGKPIAAAEAVADPERETLQSKDLQSLTIEDLDVLESLATKLAGGQPDAGPRSDPGGQDSAG